VNDIDLSPDVLVIGGGIAGVLAAARAKERGARVVLVRKSGGGTQASSGAIDIADELVATVPGANADPLDRGGRTRKSVDAVAARMPRHPYARVGDKGRERMREALSLLRERARPLDLVERDDGHNHVVATQIGTLKRTGVVQRSQLLDFASLDEGAVVGVVQLADLAGYDARPVVHTLSWLHGMSAGAAKKARGARAVPIHVERTLPDQDVHLTMLDLALRLDDDKQRAPLVEALKAALRAPTRVPTHLLFPPALGVDKPGEIIAELEKATGKIVRESLALFPSVPGERLARALMAALRTRGVTVLEGAATEGVVAARRATRVHVEGARLQLELSPRAVVLADGRFFSGGIVRNQRAQEPVFDLPVVVHGAPLGDRFVGDVLDTSVAGEHALFRAGIAVDDRLRPVDGGGALLLENVTCAGTVIEGWDPARDGTGGAVAALTGMLAGEQAAATAKG
jgi:glycerol-3-phosphate dehydrogenase subunit B